MTPKSLISISLKKKAENKSENGFLEIKKKGRIYKALTLQCIIFQNDQSNFNNLAVNAARFLSVSDHFGTLCI